MSDVGLCRLIEKKCIKNNNAKLAEREVESSMLSTFRSFPEELRFREPSPILIFYFVKTGEDVMTVFPIAEQLNQSTTHGARGDADFCICIGVWCEVCFRIQSAL